MAYQQKVEHECTRCDHRWSVEMWVGEYSTLYESEIDKYCPECHAEGEVVQSELSAFGTDCPNGSCEF